MLFICRSRWRTSLGYARLVHPRTREIDLNIRGLSVTSPHKSAVMSFVDWVEPAAAKFGAVNTIVVEGNELHGYNTDSLAFIQVIKGVFGELRNARCAVIGSGGAARAILWSLKLGGASMTVFARNEAQSKALAAEFGAGCESLNNANFATFDLVINATPLGTAGDLQEQTPALAAQLRGARLACVWFTIVRDAFLREVVQLVVNAGWPANACEAGTRTGSLVDGIEASNRYVDAAHEALMSR